MAEHMEPLPLPPAFHVGKKLLTIRVRIDLFLLESQIYRQKKKQKRERETDLSAGLLPR